ncbi:pyruvate kinase [Candidatus Uhrbacteria bacterium]|nr:pyruvate kinase [Candidatus Uhrbacteria bacterium]
MPMPKKRTKIVCTIGPATSGPSTLAKLMDAGMNVARLNFSHGTHADHKKILTRVRSTAKKKSLPVAVLQDLQGPKIRTGDLPGDGIELKAGEKVVLTTSAKSAKNKIPVTYKNLHKDAKAGQKILMDDGLLDMKVVKVSGRDIHCLVGTGGLLKSHKGINLPDTKVSASALPPKDKKDAEFGVINEVDWMALSFVRSASEVQDLRKLITKYEKKHKKKSPNPIRIIAKIEKREAVDDIENILQEVDAIMVARGDLGIEIPAEEVPLIQKSLIEKARRAAKPVVVATQMLDSMIRNPRPTRAEVSDVANAIIDHTDAIMLSGETAVGKYPVDAVKTMARIAQKTESSKFDDADLSEIKRFKSDEEAVTNVGAILAKSTSAKLILATSMTGNAARIVSRYRAELPILVATHDERVRRQLAMSWGVTAFTLPKYKDADSLVANAISYIKDNKYVKTGNHIILITGTPVGVPGNINSVEIVKI